MGREKNSMLPMILLLGPPGIGKTTLCEALSVKLRLYHLSVGNFCRALDRGETLKGVSECSPEVHNCLKFNEPLPGEILTPLLRNHLHAVADEREYDAIILDGFPRSSEQQKMFEQSMPAPLAAISLQCPTNIVKERYLGRKDPRRPDENEELFKIRMDRHLGESAIVEEVYGKRKVLHKVDASGEVSQYIKIVAERVETAIHGGASSEQMTSVVSKD